MSRIRDIDAIVRANSITMLGTDALAQRYVTALNMLAEHAAASSPGFRRWKPVDVKVTVKEVREPL